MGSYCRYCNQRCFVVRVIPDGPLKGRSFALATCRAGMEHDLRETGHTHITALNPVLDAAAVAALAAEGGAAMSRLVADRAVPAAGKEAAMTPPAESAPTLQDLADAARAAVLQRFAPESCIATTRVVIDVLRYCGMPGRPWPVKVRAFGPLGWELWTQKVPIGLWPKQAAIVEIAPEHGDFVGHIVAVTATGPAWTRRIVVDASIDQAARPARGIDPGRIVAAMPDGYDMTRPVETLLWEVGNGTRVAYAAASGSTFKRSSNWQSSHPEVRAAVAETIKVLGVQGRG